MKVTYVKLYLYHFISSSWRDNITRINHHIRGIIHFRGRCCITVLSLKNVSAGWRRKKYINCLDLDYLVMLDYICVTKQVFQSKSKSIIREGFP